MSNDTPTEPVPPTTAPPLLDLSDDTPLVCPYQKIGDDICEACQ